MKIRLFVLMLLVQSHLSLAQQRPLVTEQVDTVEKGSVRFELGVEFYQDAVFTVSGLEGDLSRIGVFGFRFGAGDRVEIQLLGSAHDFLNVDRRFPAPNSGILNFSGNSTSDFGDLTLATKVRLNSEGASLPAFGFRFGFELPNSSNESGLGNDETNVFVALLAQKEFARLKLAANLGLAILGDPVDAGAQDDLLTYGFAAVFTVQPRFKVLADYYGRSGAGGFGTEEQARLRAGVQILAASLYWDIAGFWGFRNTDPDTGLIFGVSRTFKLPF